MILYLLKSGLCLLILLLVYRLILQREAIYQFNRFYLLAAVIGSFLIPMVAIEVPSEPSLVSRHLFQESEFSANLQEMPLERTEAEPVFQAVETKLESDWTWILWSGYGLITLIFFIRFVWNIILLVDKINQNVHVTYRGETLVLLKTQSLPFSFLSYIFVSKDYFENHQLTDAIFAHEQAHVHGKHSWDNLLIEALLVPFWFHPGLYLARQAIKLNHEFIADEAALQVTPVDQYKIFLLAMMLPDQHQGLVSPLNFSLTKKRFEMMKRKTANSTKWKIIFVLVPVLAGLVYVFGKKVTPKVDSSSDPLIGDEQILSADSIKNERLTRKVFEGNDTVRVFTIKYGIPFQLLTKAEYYSETKFVITNSNGGTQEVSYSDLPEIHQKSLPNPPGELKKNAPTQALFESWKNGEEYAIWIDDKVALNSHLEEMEVSDVAHYQSSFVNTNARSERFPQKYQVRIYTSSGFERSYGKDSNFGKKPMGGTITFIEGTPKNKPVSGNSSPESNFQNPPSSKEYQRRVAEFQLKISHSGMFTSQTEEEIASLRKQFQALEAIYFNLPMEERRKVSRAGFPFAKIEVDGQIRYKKFEFLTAEERKALDC